MTPSHPCAHPLDAALALQALGAHDPHAFTGHTSPAYANMVGPFGGVTCAVMLQAVMQHAQRLGEPVAQTVNYAAPVADGPFVIRAEPVRTNRSTQHWMLMLRCGGPDGEVAATGTVVTAVRRAGWSAQDARMPEGLPTAHGLPPLRDPQTPTWVARYDMRFIDGGWPEGFSGEERPDGRSSMWVRDEPARTLDLPALSALCDSFFPRIFVRRQQRLPIGTVSLSHCFHAGQAELGAVGEEHVLATAHALAYRDGFFDQRGEIWSPDGRLLASTQQIVYYRT